MGEIEPNEDTHIDWKELTYALFGPDEMVDEHTFHQRFMGIVLNMPDEKFSFIAMAMVKRIGPISHIMTQEERVALARVCRRIIRESKENEESK